MRFATVLLLGSTLLLAACSGAPPVRHLVILIDVSGSIEKAAERDAYQAIADGVKLCKRGDSFSMIPITSDAETQTQGHILRFKAPAVREAYDQDLKRFADTVRRSLEESKAAAVTTPGARTDILGTIRLAQEEFGLDAPGTERVLVVLSDFVQDDAGLNFKTERLLATPASTNTLAIRLGKGLEFPVTMRVFLGSLRSTDLAGLDRERRRAIQEFWMQYFISRGVQPIFATDGPGLLSEFLLTTQHSGAHARSASRPPK
jgi:hypothetical protein